MELSGSRLVPGSQQRTWDKLIAPETLKVCITGCERIERLSDNEYRVGLRADVGPVSGHFDGKLKLTDIQPPHSYHLVFEGEGLVAGRARGHADIRLTPEGQDTRLSYTAHADLEGKLSQLRPEQAEKIARKMTDSFFSLLSVCASRVAERAEAPRIRPERMAASGATSHFGEIASRLSWVIVAGVIAMIVAYHTFMR